MNKSFISDIVWIQRGIPQSIPTKIALAEKDLKGIIQNNDNDSSDENDERYGSKTSLRGGAIGSNENLQKYNIENYDKEKEKISGPSMKGLSCYSSMQEDPYITSYVDSDEEREREDFEIKPDDNLVVAAKFFKDESTLEVYVYNENNDDWYLHHDYILEVPALCLSAFNYDPGSENEKGNLLAVGSMNSFIDIWDVDIVNAVEPVLSLGKDVTENINKISKKTSISKSNKKLRKKRDGSAQHHSDAVLSLDWNHLAKHVLASGSADKTVILWDLDEAKPAQILNSFDGMVQSLQWHVAEQSILLSGTRSGDISVFDCRTLDTKSALNWSVGKEYEVERVLWNHFEPYYAFCLSNDGKLRYFDTRKSGEFVTEVLAHEGASSFSQSFEVRNLICTSGNQEIKIWKLENNSNFSFIYKKQMNMGNVNVTKFSPNSGSITAIGADEQDLLRIVDLSKINEVVAAFNKIKNEVVADGNEENMKVDEKMEDDHSD